MSALPPPFGEMPHTCVDGTPEDLSTQALRDDPFANPPLPTTVDDGRYSPRHRLSSRPPPPYAPPANGRPAANSAGAGRATELPFASARYPPGPNLTLRGAFSPAHTDQGLLSAHGVAPSAFVPPAATAGRDATLYPAHDPAQAAAWAQVPMQSYDPSLAAPRPRSPKPMSTVPDKRLMEDALEPQPQLHRRRQFKYLTDDPAPPSNAKDAKPPEQPESRKKVKRACVYCKRSHMPCDISRPCKRCVKRGIAHLCKDEPPTEAPAPRKRKDASAPRTSRERQASPGGDRASTTTEKGSHPPSAAEPEAKRGPARMMLPISLLLTDSPPDRRPVSPSRERNGSSSDMDLTRTSSRRSSSSDVHLADAEQVDVNAEVQKLMELIDPDTRKLIQSILNSAGAKDASCTGAPHNNGETVERMILRTNAVQEEALTLAVMRARPNEPWSWGYTSLAKWMKGNYTPKTNKSIDSFLGQIRLRYLTRSVGMTREQLQATEEAAMLGISHYRLSVFESVPHGMFICSRTGRLMANNRRLSDMLLLPEHVISSGEFYYFYMISDPQVMPIAKAYLRIALNLGVGEKGSEKEKESVGESGQNPMSTNCVNLCHDFDVDRARTLKKTPAWDYATGSYLPDAPRELEDGTPSVVHFKGLVTLQARTHETSNGVPLFLVAYVSEPPVV